MSATFDEILAAKRKWDFGLEEIDLKAAALVARELYAVIRFKGNPHIDQKTGTVSTGAHVESVHAMGLGLLDALPEGPELRRLRRGFHRGVESHDWGEAIKEFFTFHAEMRMQPGDITATERRIAEYAISAAYTELEQGPPGLLAGEIAAMRTATARLQGHAAAAEISRHIAARPLPAPRDPAAHRRRVAAWMTAYDAAENDDARDASFVGSAVKLVERLECEIYYLDKAGENGSISTYRENSFQVMREIDRIEAGFGALVALASNPAEAAFAKAIGAVVYDTAERKLNGVFSLVDRQATRDSEPSSEADPREIGAARRKLRARWRNQPDARGERWMLHPVVPTALEAELYRDAKSALGRGEWRPSPGDILMRMTERPQGLRKLHARRPGRRPAASKPPAR
jgi:hypothetical protein